MQRRVGFVASPRTSLRLSSKRSLRSAGSLLSALGDAGEWERHGRFWFWPWSEGNFSDCDAGHFTSSTRTKLSLEMFIPMVLEPRGLATFFLW